jgi:hypothetical protein
MPPSIEADIDCGRRRSQSAFQRLFVADLFQQAAGAQFGKNGRCGSHVLQRDEER